MLNFKTHYLEEKYQDLQEALITFGGKAYPKFNNVVIMAGGAGSGKGFVLSNLVGVEGKVFDVDALKSLAMRSDEIKRRAKKEFGVDLSDLKLKNPADVSKLHMIISDMGVSDLKTKTFMRTVLTADPSRKPNLIFDVTLKDLRKLDNLTTQLEAVGYDKRNIHIVWVVNDIEMAKKQNQERTRTVDVDILVNTHRGASTTMKEIVDMGQRLKKFMDGDIVFAFNKFKVDSELIKSKSPQSTNPVFKSKKGNVGQYIKKSDYVYVKRRGKPPISSANLADEIKDKIRSYVPKSVEW